MKTRITYFRSMLLGAVAVSTACGADLDLTSGQGQAGGSAASNPPASTPAASDPPASTPAASDPETSDPETSDPEASDPPASDPAASEAAPSTPADLDTAAPDTAASSVSGDALVGVDCDPEAPEELDACGIEGQVCGWSGPDAANVGRQSYRECACREAGEDDLRWHCYQNAGGLGSCPAALPEHGSSCFGNFGSVCYYPERTECLCNPGGSEAWECTAPPALPDYQAPPADPLPDVPIVELDAAGRDAWCRWFVDAASGPGFAPRADAAVDADGYTSNTGCSFGAGFPCNAALAPLSPAQCAQNLALSTCTAPIAELTDCVATVYSYQCRPPEHGCARFLEKPGCAGTIVVPFDQMVQAFDPLAPEPCRVRVR